VLLAPHFLIIPALIKLESPGPLFVKYPRISRNGTFFDVLKFRTMRFQSYLRVPRFRVTRVGSFLRRFSLDELPTLFNVLKGDRQRSASRLIGEVRSPAKPQVQQKRPLAMRRTTARY
jgi:O-antigen biosynthesis protein WbqP